MLQLAKPRVRALRGADVAGGFAVAFLVVLVSVVTVLRYTVDYLQADGVEQSTMSIQDVDLFFWGQNRFAAFVSALASPIANPAANLFACLLINALSFHVFLLVVARMGTHAVTGSRRALATVTLFLALVGTAHLLIAPPALHILVLESQPYSMSWAATLGAFLLWKRREWWAWALSAALVAVAVGLNQSTVLIAAFLAVLEMVRRRQWVRWPVFGVVFIALFGVWQLLSTRYGGNAGPIPDANTEYFSFGVGAFVTGAPKSLVSILGAFRVLRLVVVLGAAALALLALNAERRASLLSRLALTFAFVLGYWTIFTGNPWVSQNGFALRYFFPVILFVVLAAAVPLGAILTAAFEPERVLHPWLATRLGAGATRITAGSSPRLGWAALALVIPVALTAVALRGPLQSPQQAQVLVQTEPTAAYARDHDVRFLSGYYWDMWPILHGALDDGRHASFVTGFKSGGDPAAYHEAFEGELAAGRRPSALCVNDSLDFCRTYLDYWTRPGWQPTGESCPVPGETPQLGSPPERSCRVLQYAG